MPLAGGLFDQPADWLVKMEQILRADAEQAKVPDSKQEAEKRLAERMRGVQGQ